LRGRRPKQSQISSEYKSLKAALVEFIRASFFFRMIFIKSDEKVKKDKKKREKSITKIKEGLERIKSLINKYEYKTISYDERKI